MDAVGRNEVGAEGLEVLLHPFSSGGDGESSIINTHPEESPPVFFLFFSVSFLFLSVSLSLLRRESTLRLFPDDRLSQLILGRTPDFVEEEDEAPVALVIVDAASALFDRPVMLPMRNRGTRVCIFCSKFRTRARISETIWTPLLFEVVLMVELVVTDETLRATVGRVVGVRGLWMEGPYSEGRVLDRAIPGEELDGVDMLDLYGWNPARWRSADWPPRNGALGVVLVGEVRLSELDDNSESCRSGGGGVLRRSLSDVIEILGRRDEGVWEEDVSVIEGALKLAFS